MELPFNLGDPEFIDACVSCMHQPVWVEFPNFRCRRLGTNCPSHRNTRRQTGRPRVKWAKYLLRQLEFVYTTRRIPFDSQTILILLVA